MGTFILGLFIGGTIGTIMVALLAAAKDEDNQRENRR
jgi:gas vesicle protein